MSKKNEVMKMLSTETDFAIEGTFLTITMPFSIVWRSMAVPKKWQTGVVVFLFKKGYQRVCANYWNW